MGIERGLCTQNTNVWWCANYKLWQKVGEKLWKQLVQPISNLSVDKRLHIKWWANVWISLFLGKTIVGTQVLSMRTAHYEMQKKELNVIVSSYVGAMLIRSKMDQKLLIQMENKYLSHLFSKDGSKSDVKVTIDTFSNILLQKWWVQFPLSEQCTAQCSRPTHPKNFQ